VIIQRADRYAAITGKGYRPRRLFSGAGAGSVSVCLSCFSH